jgi:hypothetical protein
VSDLLGAPDPRPPARGFAPWNPYKHDVTYHQIVMSLDAIFAYRVFFAKIDRTAGLESERKGGLKIYAQSILSSTLKINPNSTVFAKSDPVFTFTPV